MDELPKPTAPLEKILGKLKHAESKMAPGEFQNEIIELVRLMQSFMRDLEHEKAHAIVQIVKNCHSMDRVEYFRGRLAMIKTMQRDYDAE